MTSCCLCAEFSSAERKAYWNQPLFESANFAVIPSLGSLVEGWLLVVPKRHFICMGALSDPLAEEMREVTTTASTELKKKYGEVCAFEHGPCGANRAVGCGVDHAHLHLVPLTFDLAEAATCFLPSGNTWSTASIEDCRLAFAAGMDYLYLEQPLGAGRIVVGRLLGSQVLRRAIASRIGRPEEFNWRDYPETENVAKTISAFGGHTQAGA